MTARIINRGRGPEIEGTRITILRVFDHVRVGDSTEYIADELRLTKEQAAVAVAYIRDHREAVEADYQKMLEWLDRVDPPEARAARMREIEDLRKRFCSSSPVETAHADRAG